MKLRGTERVKNNTEVSGIEKKFDKQKCRDSEVPLSRKWEKIINFMSLIHSEFKKQIDISQFTLHFNNMYYYYYYCTGNGNATNIGIMAHGLCSFVLKFVMPFIFIFFKESYINFLDNIISIKDCIFIFRLFCLWY